MKIKDILNENSAQQLDELKQSTLASDPETSDDEAKKAIKKGNKRYSGITRATKKELKIK